MDEETLVHPYPGVLLSNKKEQAIDTCNNVPPTGVILSERTAHRDSIYMTYEKAKL